MNCPRNAVIRVRSVPLSCARQPGTLPSAGMWHGGANRRCVSMPAMRGISLFIVLIALVMLSLAAVGLIRMVDTGALVAGNLSFKQATTLAADRATEQAIGWIDAHLGGGTLMADVPASGYYATAMLPLDTDGSLVANKDRNVPDWVGNNCSDQAEALKQCLQTVPSGQLVATATTGPGVSPPSVMDGITTRVLITRMCKEVGDPDVAGNSCVRPIATQKPGAGYKGASLGGGYATAAGASKEFGPYFRIVVRAEGPRQTVSTTEATVHFPRSVSP